MSGMKPVDLYARVRYACHVEGLSQRETARRFGIDTKTVRKMLTFAVPQGVLVACAHLKRKRTLASLGNHHIRVKAKPDLAVEPETIEAAGCQDDCVETAFSTLAQARIDVAA